MISEKRFNAFDLPGKLGNPLMRLQEEPRLDPRIYKAMERLGLFAETPDLPVNIDSSIDEIRDFCNQAEMGYEHQSKITHADWEPLAGVEVENRQILGSDGNEIDIFVHRPGIRLARFQAFSICMVVEWFLCLPLVPFMINGRVS